MHIFCADLEAMCNRKEGEEARGKSNDLEGTNKSNILDQGKTEVEDARLLGWLATLPIHRVDIIWHFLGRVKSAEERSSEDDPRVTFCQYPILALLVALSSCHRSASFTSEFRISHHICCFRESGPSEVRSIQDASGLIWLIHHQQKSSPDQDL